MNSKDLRDYTLACIAVTVIIFLIFVLVDIVEWYF